MLPGLRPGPRSASRVRSGLRPEPCARSAGVPGFARARYPGPGTALRAVASIPSYGLAAVGGTPSRAGIAAARHTSPPEALPGRLDPAHRNQARQRGQLKPRRRLRLGAEPRRDRQAPAPACGGPGRSPDEGATQASLGAPPTAARPWGELRRGGPGAEPPFSGRGGGGGNGPAQRPRTAATPPRRAGMRDTPPPTTHTRRSRDERRINRAPGPHRSGQGMARGGPRQ